MQNSSNICACLIETDNVQTSKTRVLRVEVRRFLPIPPTLTPEMIFIKL
jgi:hypothetical protein